MIGADPRVAALRDALPGQVLLGSRGVRYHVRDRIGEGGQGWVYRATWDGPDGFFVTVKVLRPDAVSPDTLARFQREAEVLRTLSQQSRPNPHIVRFFDHATARIAPLRGGEPITIPFTVLEYVHGSTLERVLSQARGQGMALDRARRLLRHVVLALEDVHRHDVVHRDLKPSNILLAYEQGAEVAKVTDFGLVKLVDMGLQQTTALAGASLGYAPPEQYEQGNQRVSPRTDVFSLAAITYEVLSGHIAFPHREGEHPLVVLTRLLNSPRPLLAKEPATLAPELRARADLVAQLDVELTRAMTADPGERHESASEFWAAIEPLLRGTLAPAVGVQRRVSPVPAAVHAVYGQPGGAPARPSIGPPRGLDSTLVSPTGNSTPPPAPRRESGSLPASADTRAANPASWTWRVLTRSQRTDAVRAAYFTAHGDVILAVGASGVVRWQRTGWSPVATSTDLDVRAIRGVKLLNSGDMLVFGEHSLAGRIGAAGAFHPWPSPDPTLTFFGGDVDEATGIVTLVGDRPSTVVAGRVHAGNRVGTLAQFVDGRLALLTDTPTCTRLRAVARLGPGDYLACGDWGAIVRLSSGVAEHVGSICGGHLTAIEALPGSGSGTSSAVTVGVGGHALFLSPRLEAQLEAVQTTRDLLCLTLAEDGVPWAGAAQARVLRRTGTSWVRMSGDLGLASAILAVHGAPGRVRAVCDDGAVVEGSLT